MVTALPTKAKLRVILNDLMRRPRTREVLNAIDKVRKQIEECPNG